MLTRALNVVTRATSSTVLKRAGLSRSARAETGIVTFIQRLAPALNPKVHLHRLMLDGTCTSPPMGSQVKDSSGPGPLKQIPSELIL